jgi:hypothetical protein
VIDTIEDTELLRRLRAEFDELPHMRLTCAQAARLTGVDDEVCALALQTLLALGYLVRQGPSYARADHDRCARVGGVGFVSSHR